MLNELLSKFGANTKITVGVAVSPGIGLEMIEVDKNTKTVSKYACRPLDYNYSTREIADYDEFRTTLGILFDELKIPRNSNIILTLPTVHFGLINLPLMLGDDAVNQAITSEVEQTYIFKRQEPVIGWTNVVKPNQSNESTEILYSAIQNNALGEIYASCIEVGCTLLGIETSYLSLLKTLYYTDLAKEQMKDYVTWNLMIINQNSYSIIALSGKNVISYYEEPLALKSFVGEEIYNAIISSSTLNLTTNPANWLYIISETDIVSAEVLSKKISFDGNITFLECNKYIQKPFLASAKNIMPNLALKITPESIGSGIYQFINYPIKLNLIGEFNPENSQVEVEVYPKVHIGNLEVELSPSFIKKMAIIGAAVFLLPALVIFFVLNIMTNKQMEEISVLDSEMSKYSEEMRKYEGIKYNVFDEKTEISIVTSKNKEKLIYYEALGLSIPAKTWITNFRINSKGKVYISGKTSSLEDVYNFYRDLKLSVINSNLKVNTLEAVDNEDSDSSTYPKFYNFEITNMDDVDLTAFKEQKTMVETKRSLDPEKALDPNYVDDVTTAPPTGQPVDPNQPPAPPPAATTTPPTTPPTTPTPNNNGLPPNLEKIENF